MTQSISWPVSGTPSRLALITSTAAGTGGTGRAASATRAAAVGQIGAGERGRQQPGQLGRPGGGVYEQAGPARLDEQLAAPAAGQQPLAVATYHADRGQGAAAAEIGRA